jgi:hypothetical protein
LVNVRSINTAAAIRTTRTTMAICLRMTLTP